MNQYDEIDRLLRDFRKTCFEVRDDLQAGMERSDDIIHAHAQAKSQLIKLMNKASERELDLAEIAGDERTMTCGLYNF
jgi:hypothetical protein